MASAETGVTLYKPLNTEINNQLVVKRMIQA